MSLLQATTASLLKAEYNLNDIQIVQSDPADVYKDRYVKLSSWPEWSSWSNDPKDFDLDGVFSLTRGNSLADQYPEISGLKPVIAESLGYEDRISYLLMDDQDSFYLWSDNEEWDERGTVFRQFVPKVDLKTVLGKIVDGGYHCRGTIIYEDLLNMESAKLMDQVLAFRAAERRDPSIRAVSEFENTMNVNSKSKMKLGTENRFGHRSEDLSVLSPNIPNRKSGELGPVLHDTINNMDPKYRWSEGTGRKRKRLNYKEN